MNKQYDSVDAMVRDISGPEFVSYWDVSRAIKKRMSQPMMRQLLDYEISAAVWPGYISWGWLQNIVASYFARKVARKYRRYLAHVEYLAAKERTAPA